MIKRIKTTAAFLTLTAGLCIAPLANAQDAYRSNFASGQNVSTTAGVHLTVPFGGGKSERVQDRARFGLMLNMTRENNNGDFYAPKRVDTNLLDLGMQFDGRPMLMIAGEDIYTPLFAPLNAKADGGNITISKNIILLVAGAALAVGAAVALAGGDDNDDDNDGDDRR
ncbi:MAG: hypothetical protein L3J65_07730 [Robiginitomaculum sp.]|nr:hypothetical protein [Robiginitomaculum sp.]